MKLRDTEFFKQYTAVVCGTFLLVMTFAFVGIPLSLTVQAGAAYPPVVGSAVV